MGCRHCGYVGGPGLPVFDTTFPCPACRRGGAVVLSNPRRNAASKKRPACGACALTWHWSAANQTGYYTPCPRCQRRMDESRRLADERHAEAERLGLEHLAAEETADARARRVAEDLRRRALERGIDDVDDVPEEARANGGCRSRRRNMDDNVRALERSVLSGNLDDVQALTRAYERTGQGEKRKPGTPAVCVDLRAGWEEVEDVQSAVRDGLDVRELWAACGQGRSKDALSILANAGYEDLVDEDGNSDYDDVWVMTTPDDMLGELLRVFVHRRS